MSPLPLCFSRRAEAGIRTATRYHSLVIGRLDPPSLLRSRSDLPKTPSLPPTRLNMLKSPLRSRAFERDLQTMSEKLGTVQISQNITASTVSSHVLAVKKRAVPAKSKTKTARDRDEKVSPSKASGGIPNPTAEYLAASSIVPYLLPQPQHLLVVIDLNGTLLFRPSRKQPTKFVARPNTAPFLKYCVDTFSVVIWSSARPENVTHMCNAILTPELKGKVIAIWGRDKFGLSKQDFDLRVQCYKRLTTLWNDRTIAKSHPEYASGGRWDQTNTVLVDDSLEKGRSEPFNLIEVPEFFGNADEQGRILPQVHDHLNHLSMHSNVSACLRSGPFRPLLSFGT